MSIGEMMMLFLWYRQKIPVFLVLAFGFGFAFLMLIHCLPVLTDSAPLRACVSPL